LIRNMVEEGELKKREAKPNASRAPMGECGHARSQPRVGGVGFLPRKHGKIKRSVSRV